MHTVFLNGGILRRLHAGDMAAFKAHLFRLDPASRHDRFSCAVSDAYLERYAGKFFGPGDVVYGFFVDAVLRGAGELRQTEAPRLFRDGSAEAAFSVEKPWRRGGAGSALMARIVRAAQNRRDRTLTMLCLAHNQPMQRLARKFSAELSFEADQITGRMVGRRVSIASLWREAMDDAAGVAGAVLQRRATAMPA